MPVCRASADTAAVTYAPPAACAQEALSAQYQTELKAREEGGLCAAARAWPGPLGVPVG